VLDRLREQSEAFYHYGTILLFPRTFAALAIRACAVPMSYSMGRVRQDASMARQVKSI
jgi:hypothetical protein